MTDGNQQGCIYRLRDDGIHEFSFTGQGERSVDEFFQQLEQVLAESNPATPLLRYLVRLPLAQGQAPLSELAKRFRKLDVALPKRPNGRTAILHKSDLLLTLMNTVIGALAPQRDKTMFFKHEREEEAITWLLSES
jgi:hypothetical protein